MTGAALASYPHDTERDLGAWSRDMAGTISRKFQNAGLRLQPQGQQYLASNPSEQNRSAYPVNHVSSPSLPEQHGGDSMSQSIGTNPKTSDPSGDPKSETRTSLHRALTLHVSDPAKVVARKTGASVDTIDNHRAGNVPQSWTQLIAYCRAYPAFGLEVLELIGIDVDRDRNAYAVFLSLQRQIKEG